jgi:DtxR family transcriptional regulator, Mn-dependent transcriptional regulator
MLSYAEENYLKSIYHLAESGKEVLTNAIAEAMNTKAASVTDMLKKLSAKKLVAYEKYHGVQLTPEGKSEALMVVRKHRLWETFLVSKLGFAWHEVHDVAEQLEHIDSSLLIAKLDEFLGFPAADPHGHPIPDQHGKLQELRQASLNESTLHTPHRVHAIRQDSPAFLQYLSKIGVYLGATVVVTDRVTFDGSLEIQIDSQKKIFISREAAENILVGFRD